MVAAVSPIVTHHALARLEERFGWAGTADQAAAQLGAIDVVATGVATHAQGTEPWSIRIPDLDMILRCRGACVLTVVRISENKAHQRRQQGPKRKSTRPGAPGRCGARRKRRPRPEHMEESHE